MKIMVSAYLDNNIGDDLMIKLLSQNFPQHEFYLYTNKSVIKDTFKSSRNIIVKHESDRINDIEKIDVFLSIGGSIFNDLNSIKGQISRLKRILFIRKLRKKSKKIVTLGCNLGPYKNKRGPLLTKYELKNNDLVTVRDKESYQMLESFNKINNFHLASDIVYNYEYKKEKHLKSFGLGISTYRSIKPMDVNLENYKVLASIIDNYIEKTQKNVVLFAFDSEKENDLSAAHHILNLSNKKEYIQISAYLGDHEDFIETMSKCERLIAIRFHSAIISNILNIPFLPIIYSNKMESFLEDTGYTGEKIYIEDLNLQKIDVDRVVNTLIKGDRLYKRENSDSNHYIHFEQLSKLLKMN